MSKSDEDIRTAQALVRDALGTPREQLAKAYLEALEARVKRESEEQRARGVR
jgi:hypothetical protein